MQRWRGGGNGRANIGGKNGMKVGTDIMMMVAIIIRKIIIIYSYFHFIYFFYNHISILSIDSTNLSHKIWIKLNCY